MLKYLNAKQTAAFTGSCFDLRARWIHALRSSEIEKRIKKLQNKAIRLFLAATLLGVLAFVPAQATAAVVALPAGGSVTPGNATGDPLGTLIDSMSSAFVALTFTGTLHTEVRQDAGGTLSFYYMVENDESSAHPIGRLTIPGFDLFLTAVGNSTSNGGGTQAATTADRNFVGVIGANYGPAVADALQPGEMSQWFVATTNAWTYKRGGANLIDGSVTTADTFVPDTGVPEPLTLISCGAGLLALGLVRRKPRED